MRHGIDATRHSTRPLGWQREGKCRAPIDRRLRRDCSSVTLDDALNDGETDACPLKFLLAVQSLKYGEQAFRIGHIEAGTVVADAVSRFARANLPEDFEYRRGHAAGEFECVGQQVHEHLPE